MELVSKLRSQRKRNLIFERFILSCSPKECGTLNRKKKQQHKFVLLHCELGSMYTMLHIQVA